jgi:hypothetical protein
MVNLDLPKQMTEPRLHGRSSAGFERSTPRSQYFVNDRRGSCLAKRVGMIGMPPQRALVVSPFATRTELPGNTPASLQ